MIKKTIIKESDAASQQQHIERVKKDPKWIANIDDPSELVQLAAIHAAGHTYPPIVAYINNPTVKAQLLSIELSPLSIEYIGNPAPEIWESVKAKKAILRSLLNLLNNGLTYSSDGTVDPQGNSGANRIVTNVIMKLFKTLRYKSCPWPELDVIEKYMNDRKIQLTETVDPKVREQRQIARVTKNPYEIKRIKTPSEAVQLAAVTRDGDALQYIDEPTDAVKLAAVKNYGHAIQDIEKPSIELQLAAVQQDPNAIASIANPDWNNTQIKKIIIKNILDDLSNELEVFALGLFKALKRKNCPWQELTVIEQHLKERGLRWLTL